MKISTQDRRTVILVGDGMGDYPLEELEGKTPLEAARTPHMDRLAARGLMGTVRTIPPTMESGSDIANMSLLGYDPLRYHTGRAPLEAASMGLRLGPDEVAFRCNLVSLDEDPSMGLVMGDYSAGHIPTAEAHELIRALQEEAVRDPLRLYPGVSYRHLLVWTGGRQDLRTIPPHDIPGEPVASHVRVYENEPVLDSFLRKATLVLETHPVNQRRREAGKRAANAVWLWGQGKAPAMPTLQERYGITGAMISAVDLLKGLGVHAGLEPIAVPGATGYLDTNYRGKVESALKALETGQLVYLHIEAPDEASHEGNLQKKLQAIEDFDEKVVAPMVLGTRNYSRVRLLVVTDHLTPVQKRTHVSDLVPFLLVADLNDGRGETGDPITFCEKTAREKGTRLDSGEDLFRLLMRQS